jgi:NADPH:quinone reductase
VHAGARVIATAGGPEKVALCRELGAHVAIDYRSHDFAPIVLEETQHRGVDVVFDNVGEAVFDRSVKCIAYNGRYLMMGFASDKKYVDEKFIVPRQISAGNFKLCGVLLAYAPPAIALMMKKSMGWNFASDALGARITREIVELVLAKQVKPVIGRVAGFDDLPAAIDAMAKRETVGRTIVKLY